jgi:hypothetical protein
LRIGEGFADPVEQIEALVAAGSLEIWKASSEAAKM